jgi:hypothetical protein
MRSGVPSSPQLDLKSQARPSRAGALHQRTSSSFRGASIAGMSAGFMSAMWPQLEATTLTLAPGMCRASFLLSTGGK